MSLERTIVDALGPAIDAAVAKRTETDLAGVLAVVEMAVTSRLAAFQPATREVVLHVPGREPVNVGRQHERFETMVRMIGAAVPVWLVGPAGSGKTVGAEHAAKALDLAFSAVSIGPQTTQVHLFGYQDAVGTYHGTEVRARFEHGGLLLLDEIDRGNPGVLTALNALLANNVCAFPDGMVARHADFRVVAAANTTGSGANRQYVGALQLDAATLDRFAVLEWPYDEAFERELAAGHPWCEQIQAWRRAADSLGIRHIISPRATLAGIRLLAAGLDADAVAEATVWRGLDANTRGRIEGAAPKRPMPAPAAPAPAAESWEPVPSDEEPSHEAAPAVKGTCPKCGRTEWVRLSKFKVDTLYCWRRKGGCGHQWSAV